MNHSADMFIRFFADKMPADEKHHKTQYSTGTHEKSHWNSCIIIHNTNQ